MYQEGNKISNQICKFYRLINCLIYRDISNNIFEDTHLLIRAVSF